MLSDQSFFRHSPFIFISVLTLLISACSSGGGDSGSNDGVQMSGAVVDGYVRHATIFVDQNNNGVLDKNIEFHYAMTDKNGRFTVGINGEQYCDVSKTDYNQQYCLELFDDTQTVVALGGIDMSSGLPFRGKMMMTVDKNGTTTNRVISPISTVISNISDDYLEQLIQDFDLDVTNKDQLFQLDPLSGNNLARANTDLSDEQKKKLLKFNYALQKFIESISATLKTKDSRATKADTDYSLYVAQAVAEAIEQKLTSSSTTIDTETVVDLLQNSDDVTDILNQAEANAEAKIDQANISFTSAESSTIVGNTTDLTDNIESQIDALNFANLDEDNRDDTIKVIELITQVLVIDPVDTDNVSKAIQVAAQLTDPDDIHIETLTQKIDADESGIFDPDALINSATTRHFPDILIGDDQSAQNVIITNANDSTKFKIWFKKIEPYPSRESTFKICALDLQDPNATPDYLSGRWFPMDVLDDNHEPVVTQINSISLNAQGAIYDISSLFPLDENGDKVESLDDNVWRFSINIPTNDEENSGEFTTTENPFSTDYGTAPTSAVDCKTLMD